MLDDTHSNNLTKTLSSSEVGFGPTLTSLWSRYLAKLESSAFKEFSSNVDFFSRDSASIMAFVTTIFASSLLILTTSSKIRLPIAACTLERATLHNSRLNPKEETYSATFANVIAACIHASLQKPWTKPLTCLAKANRNLEVSTHLAMFRIEQRASARESTMNEHALQTAASSLLARYPHCSLLNFGEDIPCTASKQHFASFK
ncbi:hypothetical protein KC19_2G179200 [Ceratodon purpureus]|uniref:Uncharacterized protein n=1 Tax=Ceratodon purpureus TaxID=3225 RepID=A0A8T0IWU6_CERPU|nr:hypothetical protein KC19_2G179200 [Ceratodon purpureus]